MKSRILLQLETRLATMPHTRTFSSCDWTLYNTRYFTFYTIFSIRNIIQQTKVLKRSEVRFQIEWNNGHNHGMGPYSYFVSTERMQDYTTTSSQKLIPPWHFNSRVISYPDINTVISASFRIWYFSWSGGTSPFPRQPQAIFDIIGFKTNVRAAPHTALYKVPGHRPYLTTAVLPTRNSGVSWWSGSTWLHCCALWLN
jgi:hypothetical protein